MILFLVGIEYVVIGILSLWCVNIMFRIYCLLVVFYNVWFYDIYVLYRFVFFIVIYCLYLISYVVLCVNYYLVNVERYLV